MRRIVFATIAALSIAACSNDATGPDSSALLAIDAAGAGTALTVVGGYDGEIFQDRLVNGLPDSLKLTDSQKAAIKAVVSAFEASTKADRDSLNKLLGDARKSLGKKGNGSTLEQTLGAAAPIIARLRTAEEKLKTDIDAILTAEQRAWVASHSPRQCKPGSFPALTSTQKAQIKALENGFRETNKADLETVDAALKNAKGKSADEIKTILDSIAPVRARLDAARKKLTDDIANVLTAEQKNSGCLPLG